MLFDLKLAVKQTNKQTNEMSAKECEMCGDCFTQDSVLTLVEPGDDEAREYSGNGQWVERTFCKNGCCDDADIMLECPQCKCIAHKQYWDHENNCCGRCSWGAESESDSDSDSD